MTKERIGSLVAQAALLASMTAIVFATACILHLAPPVALAVAAALVAAGRTLVAWEHRLKARRRTVRTA